MTKAQLIKTIEALYPADSQNYVTAKTGIHLLFQSIADEWRHLPVPILERYAALCIEKEREESK